jgi:2-haloalkanoic acid dehalogenase type II
MSTERYRAVVFDLLTALLDSWSLWSAVAGSESAGLGWRRRYLELTYGAGPYRSYEGIIAEAASAAGLPAAYARELVRRWGELAPWPETRPVVQALVEKVPVAVATNASVALGRIAVARVGVAIPIVVTAEEAGAYKPRPEPYRMALHRLGVEAKDTLFVAGSAADVPGASAVGMPVFWHNRIGASPVDPGVRPRYVADSLWPVLELV